ncbi:MAG TPA: AbrB protein, partial [Synergistaceae bacterium]|nr:AbrB protein [Synergistaceae bacterium]
IIFVALGNLLGVPFSSLPEFMRILAQIGLGVVVASHITSQTLSGFLAHAALIVLSTGTMLLLSILLGMLLHRMTGWDYPTCLLSTSLGGISQMSIIAEDMGADPLKVSILQTVRLVTILLVLPPLYAYLLTS